MIGSHMLPHTAHAVWAFCWAMSLFQRTAAHPPMAMLQDLQVPTHAGSSKEKALLPGSAAGTVCMRLILVAVEQSVLCLGMWPRTDGRLHDSAGDVLKQAPNLDRLVTKGCQKSECACLYRHMYVRMYVCPGAIEMF